MSLFSLLPGGVVGAVANAPTSPPRAGSGNGLIDFIKHGPQAGQRGGVGGLFDRIEASTQSPLFGLGIGLLSGDPQAGLRNAQSLARDQHDRAVGQSQQTTRRQRSAFDLKSRLNELQRNGVDLSRLSETDILKLLNE